MTKTAKAKTAKPPKNALPADSAKYITKFEYVCIMLARIGGQFGSTLTGTLATAFLHELYFGPVGVDSETVAQILIPQTTITTICSVAFALIAGVIVQKWKSRWGRYRQWYIICLIPTFVLTVLFFYVPKGWSVQQMIMFRYGIACCQTVFNIFNNLGQNVVQVISPNHKEKKTVATIWQLSYYLGYGGAYLATFVYGIFSDDKNKMYMILAIVAASVTMIGNLMVGLFCKERIELPKKEKVKISKSLFTLFGDKNYVAYHIVQWAGTLAMLGKMSTYLAAITVGSSKNLLLTLPTAVGTVVGNLITTKLSKKFEPTKLLKFCGPYSMISAFILFGICFVENMFGLKFFVGWNSVFFYAFYFIFGIGIGIQELSSSHLNVEFYDYLEWKTGERMEAVQGIFPGWVSQGLNYLKELLIPFMVAWVGYKTSLEGDLVVTMSKEPTYMRTCLWLLAFLVFGYALCNLIRSIALKAIYNVEGERKAQMYRELQVMRAERHQENIEIEAEKVKKKQ